MWASDTEDGSDTDRDARKAVPAIWGPGVSHSELRPEPGVCCWLMLRGQELPFGDCVCWRCGRRRLGEVQGVPGGSEGARADLPSHRMKGWSIPAALAVWQLRRSQSRGSIPQDVGLEHPCVLSQAPLEPQ